MCEIVADLYNHFTSTDQMDHDMASNIIQIAKEAKYPLLIKDKLYKGVMDNGIMFLEECSEFHPHQKTVLVVPPIIILQCAALIKGSETASKNLGENNLIESKSFKSKKSDLKPKTQVVEPKKQVMEPNVDSVVNSVKKMKISNKHESSKPENPKTEIIWEGKNARIVNSDDTGMPLPRKAPIIEKMSKIRIESDLGNAHSVVLKSNIASDTSPLAKLPIASIIFIIVKGLNITKIGDVFQKLRRIQKKLQQPRTPIFVLHKDKILGYPPIRFEDKTYLLLAENGVFVLRESGDEQQLTVTREAYDQIIESWNANLEQRETETKVISSSKGVLILNLVSAYFIVTKKTSTSDAELRRVIPSLFKNWSLLNPIAKLPKKVKFSFTHETVVFDDKEYALESKSGNLTFRSSPISGNGSTFQLSNEFVRSVQQDSKLVEILMAKKVSSTGPIVIDFEELEDDDIQPVEIQPSAIPETNPFVSNSSYLKGYYNVRLF